MSLKSWSCELEQDLGGGGETRSLIMLTVWQLCSLAAEELHQVPIFLSLICHGSESFLRFAFLTQNPEAGGGELRPGFIDPPVS